MSPAAAWPGLAWRYERKPGHDWRVGAGGGGPGRSAATLQTLQSRLGGGPRRMPAIQGITVVVSSGNTGWVTAGGRASAVGAPPGPPRPAAATST